MEARLLIVFSIFVLGNLYWGYRYFSAYKDSSLGKGERQEALEDIEDYWLQFACVAIIIIMLIAPIANSILSPNG
ncbi:hypothetical protein [Ferrimonas senticii]|uniref:hypothetical protein n=1 Tax=Ferrimonas senticii TaxID=394566 RepID=UPI0003FF7199|nr:hypothetical protein [Ferrimonas senticii]